MNRTRALQVAVLSAAVIAAAIWWTSSRSGGRAGVTLGGLGAGEQQVYELSWDGRSTADAAELPGGTGAYSGDVSVRARLVVRGLGAAEDGGRLVSYRLADVERATYRVMGRDVMTGVDATAGELVAVLDSSGRIRALRPDPAMAPAADLLLRAIVQQSAVTLGAGASWDATEPGPSGTARMRYRREGMDALVRTRTGYATLTALPAACPSCREELDGVASIRLDGRGALRTLDDRERLVVTEGALERLTLVNRFTLRATGTTLAVRPLPQLAGRTALPPEGGVMADEGAQARARDWSLDRIGTTVMRFVATGATPVETTWMHGVAAYLREHPEACAELLRMFAAPGLPASGRQLIASMLTAAGTPAAQAALRDGVDWLAQAHADDEVAGVLTRVALVKAPTGETVTWLAGHREGREEHPATATAATLALGAALHGLDDRELASRHAAVLREELAAFPERRVELLGALGNAGRADDGPAIAALARDPDAAVRHQVSFALRKLGDDAAVPALIELAGDGDPGVRTAALEMLGRRSLDAATARRAADASIAAGARGDELGAVIELLAPHAADAAVASSLRSLLELSSLPALRARIQHLLAGAA